MVQQVSTRVMPSTKVKKIYKYSIFLKRNELQKNKDLAGNRRQARF